MKVCGRFRGHRSARRCAHHRPGNERAGAPADLEPAEVPVVDRSGEPAVNGNVPVDDGAEAEARRGAPTACPGSEPAGAFADAGSAAALRVAGSDE
jgi:hypothetical protein